MSVKSPTKYIENTKKTLQTTLKNTTKTRQTQPKTQTDNGLSQHKKLFSHTKNRLVNYLKMLMSLRHSYDNKHNKREIQTTTKMHRKIRNRKKRKLSLL
jgi:hypothetical protein